jgi:hypothetical protein
VKIGVFGRSPWSRTCRLAGHCPVELPFPEATVEDVAARLRRGRAVWEQHPNVDFLLDLIATGLQFVPEPGDSAAGPRLALLHERLGVPLVSHFGDPVWSCLRPLPLEVRWSVLQSRTWHKFVSDRADAHELRQFGVPNVHHLPLAVAEYEFDTRPLDPGQFEVPISFVGSQAGTYFYPGRLQAAQFQLAGVLAHAYRASRPQATFYEIYHEVYGLAEPPAPQDSPAQRAAKMENYYNAKLFYMAALWMAQRDRFVIFLKRRLPDHFRIVGRRWSEAYGLPADPPIPDYLEYLRGFRRCAINLNCVSGNAETGLNLRAFEITAAGGFLLHRRQPELAECFEIGRECEAFDDEAELLDKCRYYLAHPQRIVEIALAGQQRTLREHLTLHRLERISAVAAAAGAVRARESAESPSARPGSRPTRAESHS